MRDRQLDDGELSGIFEADDAPDWRWADGRLSKAVRCAGFAGSLVFVAAVGSLAEAADHHPDIDIRYDRVHLSLVTHDSGGITRRDIELARQIDGVTAGVA